MSLRIPFMALCACVVLVSIAAAQDDWLFSSPAGDRFARIVPDGETVLPNGRLLTPKGPRLYSGENLWNTVPSPDGKYLIGMCNSGIVVCGASDRDPQAPSHLLPWKSPAFCGVFTKDSSKLIISSGDSGHGIRVLSTASWSQKPAGRLAKLEAEDVLSIVADRECYINDLVLSPDERYVFGVDVARQHLVVFDLVEQSVISDTPAGREPFSVALSADGKRLFVANIGMLDYSLIINEDGDPRGLKTPAFGFPSIEAEEGVRKEGKIVPGLGIPRQTKERTGGAVDSILAEYLLQRATQREVRTFSKRIQGSHVRTGRRESMPDLRRVVMINSDRFLGSISQKPENLHEQRRKIRMGFGRRLPGK